MFIFFLSCSDGQHTPPHQAAPTTTQHTTDEAHTLAHDCLACTVVFVDSH